MVTVTAESSIAALLNWVHRQSMRAQGVWVMKTRWSYFVPLNKPLKLGADKARALLMPRIGKVWQ